MRLHNYTPPPTFLEQFTEAMASQIDQPGTASAREEFLVSVALYAISTPAELNEAHQAVHEQLDDMIGPLAAAYEGVLRAAGKRMSNQLRALATDLTADARFTPPDEDEVTDRDKLAADMAESAAVAQHDASREVAKALEASGVSFDVDQVFTEELLEAIGERTTFAADQELRSIYRDLIADAAEQGWTIPEAAGAIVEKVDAVATYRAVAMARTDLVGLANGGSVHAATQTVGKEQTLYKTWLATDDERTRESHIDADGQSVLVNEYFQVGGVPLAYPGDPFGTDEEVINCRCTVIYGSEPASAVVSDPNAPTKPDPLEFLNPSSENTAMAREIWSDAPGGALGDLAAERGITPDEYRRQLEEKLTRDLADVRIKVRTPADVAVEIANDGRFMTQFETQTSSGAFAPEMRRSSEQGMFGIDYLAEAEERPIYGYLDASRETVQGPGGYGEVAFVLKEEVRDRTTWTSVDSLNSQQIPSPINRPSVLSVDPYRTDDPLQGPLHELTTHYLEAQVFGGVSVEDVERIEVWYEQYRYEGAQTTDQGFLARARQVEADLRAAFPGVQIDLREYEPSDYIAGLRVSRRASGEQVLGAGDDLSEVEVSLGLTPVPARDDAESRQLVADDLRGRVVHPHERRLEPVPATAAEQHEVALAPDSDDLHTSDDTSDVGGSQPRGGIPSHAPNEEEPMSTTVNPIDELAAAADGDGEIAVTPVGWDAVLCVEGVATEDGRLLERGSIAWRDLPLTLMGMVETSGWGHEGAKVAGRIDTISRVMDELASTGQLTSSFGIDELAPLIADRTVRGVSVDLAVLDYEYRDRNTGAVLSEDDLFDYWMEGRENEVVFTVLDGTIVGATVCPMPAIANAEIALAASAGLEPAQRAILAAALEGKHQLLSDVPIIRVFTPFDRQREGLFAAAAMVELADPPLAAFELTEFPGNTPFTVTEPDETGWRRVFGHLATWDTCHVGIPGVCTTAPRSSTDPAYALFHQHQYPTAEGGLVDVGVMMLGTGHASLGASRMQATQHYDKPDMIGAYVRAYDGEHGIWVSGVARDTLTPSGLRELRTNPPSGDWRQYNGRLELIAACAVAVPGFPVVASATANIVAAGGHIEIDALIASAGEIVPSAEVKAAMVAAGCACDDQPSYDEGLDDLADLSL